MKSGNPNSGIYEMDTSRTLDTGACSGNGGQVVVFDGRQAASEAECIAFTQNQREEVRDLGNCAGALAADAGVHQQTYVLQGNMIGRDDKHGPQGSGINSDISFTLTETDRHGVAYSMTCGSFTQVCEDKSPTLMSRDYKDAPIVFGNNGFGRWNEKPATLKANGGDYPGGENMVVEKPVKEFITADENRYVVRRLTPKECALLQGFNPDWCSGLETLEPTEEDIIFWSEVWEVHRKIMGTSKKPKSRSQIFKWLQNPHSDSAEYRLWGNGVALPCVVYVLGGIAHVEGLK